MKLLEKRGTGNSNGAPFYFPASKETEKKVRFGKKAGFEGIYNFKFLEWSDFTASERKYLEDTTCDDTSFFEVL